MARDSDRLAGPVGQGLNTAISAFMELLNDLNGQKLKLGKTNVESVLVSISVFAPHFASELLEELFNKKLSDCSWPVFDPALASLQESCCSPLTHRC